MRSRPGNEEWTAIRWPMERSHGSTKGEVSSQVSVFSSLNRPSILNGTAFLRPPKVSSKVSKWLAEKVSRKVRRKLNGFKNL